MTQAVNLANFANNLDTSGGVNPSALNAAVTVSKGGTGATTTSGARTNLGVAIGTDVPSPTGTGASGTWPISITGNAATATTAANGGVTSVNGATGAVTVTGGFQGIGGQLFSASGTFTVPAGVTAVKVTVISGGGGGGGAYSVYPFYSVGGGGGSGAVAIGYVTGLTSGGTVTVTVGTGGAGGSSGANGTAGGTSSFGSYIICTGGNGGTYSGQAYSPTCSGGTGGTASGASITFSLSGNQGGGNTGIDACGAGASIGWPRVQAPYGEFVKASVGIAYGFGGQGGYSGGGASSSQSSDGGPATSYGSGGGGASTLYGASKTGGAGSAGFVLVEW
jgi:hypothetical protein